MFNLNVVPMCFDLAALSSCLTLAVCFSVHHLLC
jgi:hypothetical protein